MPSLIDIRRRIRSVRSTQQITKAMKMVSAARLRRSQDRVLAARPYAALLRQMIGNVAAAVSSDERIPHNPLLAERPESRVLLILITADRGLAGAFNANLLKTSQRFLEEKSGEARELLLIGRKGRDFYRKRRVTVIGEYTGLGEKAQYRDAVEIAARVIERFRSQEIDAVYLINNEFRSVMSQKLAVGRVLPLELPRLAAPVDYIFEQPPERMLDQLLPRYIEVEVYRALLESAAAEHAARMTAMDQATSNASEMIDKLTLYMNRVRQASITKELIEVVSGAAALE
ncbi:MAG: ATP synthase F1 subunit gamma [Acidobacteria bacterium]|nr:ATP synthase F1 subunit gamma [Acidobacteriota bacterium]